MVEKVVTLSCKRQFGTAFLPSNLAVLLKDGMTLEAVVTLARQAEEESRRKRGATSESVFDAVVHALSGVGTIVHYDDIPVETDPL